MERQLEKAVNFNFGGPVLQDVNSRYEIGERAQGIGCGGIGAIHKMVSKVGLVKEIDSRLHLLKLLGHDDFVVLLSNLGPLFAKHKWDA